MPDIGELFHVGIRVGDIDRAMADLATGERFWAQAQHRQQPVWLPDTGPTELDLRFTYSSAGPLHLELLQGPPGTIWGADQVPGPHHLGYWVDDVGAVTEALVADGWTLEAASRAPEDGYGAFTYVRSPDGVLIEPVSTAVRAGFERWWAGEDL